MDIMQVIDDQVKTNDVILYMKGTPQFPQCGFSGRVVETLGPYGVPFAYVNILDHPEIRSNLPKYANWPTFPQLWVKGELVGGCDIIIEMAQSGELEPMLKAVGGEAPAE
ncbi:MAG: Grx4 family monothiol glutaredoxin [Gammaproteobacteria bacterium]|nr:Grx4 family monothiol glutaredoxin [Gammaproteobacteria bacterium]